MGARRLPVAALPPITERRFQQQVLDLAKLLHWRSYHTWNSMHSTGGFPDLVLVKRPRIVFAELKREGKAPTPEQQAWLDDLRACGAEAYLWRPSDWPEIERLLR